MGSHVGRVILGQNVKHCKHWAVGTCMDRGEVLVQEPGCWDGWHPPGKGIDKGAHAPG